MISVIVPVHNGEKTLRKCVDSILHSTVADIEIILVENGSTDRTLEICQEYSNSHQNVKTIVADTECGLCAVELFSRHGVFGYLRAGVRGRRAHGAAQFADAGLHSPARPA